MESIKKEINIDQDGIGISASLHMAYDGGRQDECFADSFIGML